MTDAGTYHIPVMRQKVREAFLTEPEGRYLDCTAGGGGHAASLLERLGTGARLVLLDRDEDAVEALRVRFAGEPRVQIVRENFEHLLQNPDIASRSPYHGILFDFGVSSHQIDRAERGFSFDRSGPLDMRMDRRDGLTAHRVVNEYSPRELERLLREFGEVGPCGKVAAAIVAERPLDTTRQLADVVMELAPYRHRARLLAQVFQAIRIEVNGELRAIDRALEAVPDLLAPGGRLVTLSYHSLEDTRVKRWLRRAAGEEVDDPYSPFPRRGQNATMKIVGRKASKASAEELEENVRARSVRMRVGERVGPSS